MKVKNINSSSKKTKQLIKETFALLLKEKQELSNITVTELVKKANITRSTFYTHYENIYALAQEFQNETMEFLINDAKKINNIDDIYTCFDDIITYLKNNEEIYRCILSSNEPLLFMKEINNLITNGLSKIINPNSNKDLNIKISFFVDGSIILLIKYFRNNIDISLEEINNQIKIIFKELFLS